MSRISNFYKKNINGIIITLSFHILVFSILYFFQVANKSKIKEAEIIIATQFDLPQPELKKEVSVQPKNGNGLESTKESGKGELKTNTASNRLSQKQNQSFEKQYEKDIEDAQNLLKNVSKQLKREIPTIDDLKMPDAPQAKPEDLKDKIYTGESNIEYYLEDRHHLKLPVPVYLAEKGGKVKVEITVDRSGNVIDAEPIISPDLSEQILSYAKTAALRTIFNSSNNAPAQQKGYIIYNFIPQK